MFIQMQHAVYHVLQFHHGTCTDIQCTYMYSPRIHRVHRVHSPCPAGRVLRDPARAVACKWSVVLFAAPPIFWNLYRRQTKA